MATKMTADDIRTAVRNIMDLPDASDLSDSLINLYMRDGYNHIIDLERRWRFLEYSFNFNTVIGQRSYNLDAIAAYPLREIISLVDADNYGVRLEMMAYDEAEYKYLGSLDTPSRPLFFANWNDNVHLFPKPDAVYNITCRAYREPFDWITTNSFVDASVNLHFAIVYFIVSKVFQHQENTALALAYKQSFDEAVMGARRDVQRPDSYQPMVLSGSGRHKRSMYGWLQSLGNNLGE